MRGLGRPPWRAHDRRCRHCELRFAARSGGIDVAGESDDRRNRGGHHARDKRESCRHTINVNSPSHRACERVKCFSNHLRNYPHFAVGVAVIQRRCHRLAQLRHGRSCVFCCSHSTSIARFMLFGRTPSTTGNGWAPRDVGVREMTASGDARKVLEDANVLPSRRATSPSDENFSLVASRLLHVAPNKLRVGDRKAGERWMS